MVLDARCLFRGKKVALGSFEKVQHDVVFERRRICQIHDDLRSCQGFVEPLSGERVDPALGGGRDHLMAALTQNGDGFRANKASAADHDDFDWFHLTLVESATRNRWVEGD